MATIINERINLQNELKKKRICRFCLTQTKLSSIFARESHALAPLSVQVMACASIEVFHNDGMPAWICADCRVLFEHSYRFKQMCKKADTLLRQFPLTGEWPRSLEKPKIPNLAQKQTLSPSSTVTAGNNLSMVQNVTSISASPSKKILNSNPAPIPEPPVPVRAVVKKEQQEPPIDAVNIFQTDCNELSMEDVQRLIGHVAAEEEYPPAVKVPPKVLNKGTIRILNKEANIIVEPKLSTPRVKLDEDGNVTVTACIDPEEPPNQIIKPAEPILTDVYPCPHCDRSFPLLQLRDIHMVNHSRERRFQCPDCDKSFFSKYDLQKHEVRHSGEKPFKCVVCQKGFSRATLLHRHERIHTEIPKYLCVYCEKAFLSKEEMEIHTARHEKNRPYKCSVCSKTFAFKQGLERHEMVHSSVQPYPCQYCDQSFPTPSKLARHLTAHAGKRPYPCKYCPKSYVLSHHLSRHMRSHKQNKTTCTCNECKKEFKTRDELIYHTAVHSTVTLVCTLCLTKFDSSEAVTQHIKEHVESDAFACEYCDLIFIRANDLITHCEVTHLKEMTMYDEDDKPIEKTSSVEALETLKTITEEETETETVDTSLTEIDVVRTDEEMHEQHLEEDAENEDQEENKIYAADDTTTTQDIASEKPKIINQVLIRSKQDLRQCMFRRDGNEAAVQNELQDISKKRRIISVEGCLKEIDVTTVDAPAQKRGKFVPPEKIHELKVEKEEIVTTMEDTKNTTQYHHNSTSSSKRRSNDNNKTMEIKKEESPKRLTRKVTISPVKPQTFPPSASNNSGKIRKPEIQPRVKHIRMTKTQAEALTKQGRIQIKDGNMVLTESPTRTRMSKREK